MTAQPRPFAQGLDIKRGAVDMTHGSGGRAMAQLIAELFQRFLDNDLLRQGNDQALFQPPPGRLVMSTDGHVISPLFFPGGDIGCLSVHGTINDVAMAGARPLYLAAGFILEEGFPLADLARIVESMARAANEAGVPVVTGDTKVVERGKADGLFITTTLVYAHLNSTMVPCGAGNQCEALFMRAESKFMGQPLAYYGFAGYAILLALAAARAYAWPKSAVSYTHLDVYKRQVPSAPSYSIHRRPR